ncbi:MAG TPA: hypothetical protein PLG90_03875 [Ignavibacteria bacterium]|nr:hypothetical protein [Ignavibacteria bacterium]
MENTKVINILKIVKSTSLNDLKHFVYTYRHKRKIVIPLFELLIKYYPDFSENDISIENIFKKLFPDKKTDLNLMRVILNDLGNVLDEFLVNEFIKENEIETEIIKLDKYRTCKLNKLFNKQLKQIEKKLKNAELPYDDVLNFELKIYEIVTLYYTENFDIKKIDEYILKYLKNLTRFFVFRSNECIQHFEISKYYNVNSNDKYLNLHKKSFNSKSFIENNLTSTDEKDKLINLYHYLTLAQKNPKNKKIEDNFYSMFEEYKSKLSKNDLKKLFIGIHYMISVKYECGFYVTGNYYFNLYKSMIENGILSFDDSQYLDSILCRNIVVKYLEYKDWVSEFIKVYIPKLKPEIKESFLHYSKAFTYLIDGDFEKSLFHLPKVESNIQIIKADVKLFYLMNYYELNYYENALSLIDSFKHYSSSDKHLKDFHTKLYKNFMKIYLKLFKIKMSGKNNEFELNKILVDLNNEYNFSHRNWLLKKTNELLNKGA